MAVLNNIRKRGIFLIIVIAMALFAFILADLIHQNGFSSDAQTNIATINGKDISRFDFANRLQSVQQNYNGNISTVQAVNQLWNATVEQTLVDEQIEKLGVEIGNQQLSSALANQFGQNPEFQTNGQFDINKFRGYIEQLKAVSPETYQQWVLNEEDIANRAKAEVYFNLLASGMEMTTAEAKQYHQLNNTKFDLDYVKVPFSAISDDEIEVSDNEIKEYINNHKKEFTTEGSRDIRYVLFEDKATAEDEQNIKSNLAQLLNDHKTYNKAAGIEENTPGFKNATNYDEYLAEFSDLGYQNTYFLKEDLPKSYADTLFSLSKGDLYGPYKEDGYWKYSKVIDTKQIPDSVKVEHILLTFNGSQAGGTVDRTKEEAKILADSLLSIVKKDADKFGDLAQEYSDDQGTATKGGEIGWVRFPKGQSNEFIDFIFSNKAGTAGMIETEYGYHIAYVQETKNEKDAIKLATLAKKIEPSDETQTKLFNMATTFQMDAKDGDFAQEAEKDSYKVRLVKNLAPLDENIAGLGQHRNIVQWAYENDTKVGDITRFDLDAGYVVAQVTSKTSKGLADVNEVRDQIKPILVQKKKAEKIKDQIKGNDLNQVASTYQTSVKTANGISFTRPNLDGNEPKVVAAAFGLNENETSKPIIGDNGVFVIQLKKKTKPEEMDSYAQLKNEENIKIMQQSSRKMFEALKDKADIKDNRAKFY